MLLNDKARYCPFCGKEREEAWSFCQFCGQTLPILGRKNLLSGEREVMVDLNSLSPFESEQADLWIRAQTYYQRNEYERSERCLRELMSRDEDNPQVLAFLGTVCVRRYRLDEAREWFDRAALLAPQSPYVHFHLAEYWLALGVPSRAEQELRKAAEASEIDSPLYDSIITVLRKVQRDKKWSFVRAPQFPSFGTSSSEEGVMQPVRRLLRIIGGEDGSATTHSA